MYRGPDNPISAVIHPNPYPYYESLVARQPFYRDDTLGMWVASSADAVSTVLTSDICLTRPRSEPIPKPLLGSAASDIFKRLIRMNDGDRHLPVKQAVSETLASLDLSVVAALSRKWASRLIKEGVTGPSCRLQEFVFHLPVYVLASSLGVAEHQLPQTASLVERFVRGIAPMSSLDQIEAGKIAAGHLLEEFRLLLNRQHHLFINRLLRRRANHQGTEGWEERETLVANAIGILSQVFEATAGLMANCLSVFADHGHVYDQVRSDVNLLRPVIEEVIRYDPPIQNTRRYLARNGVVAGRDMNEGDTVLIILAAANRDPSANPDPEQFEILRRNRRTFTFGVRPHACPGEELAKTIASAGIEQLIASGVDPKQIDRPVSYMPSVNARIPLLRLIGC